MRQIPPCTYSNSAIERAGEFLGKTIPPDRKEDAIRYFRIAHQWRAAHIYPMERIRMSVLNKARKISPDAISAARLKRMASIRRKLRNKMRLSAIQDIGGCRIIFESVTQVSDLIRSLSKNVRHELVADYDYVERPKNNGYRSRHLVFRFRGNPSEIPFNRHKIEVQIRTRLQHAWATAVEAVGLVTRESLKNDEGDPRWRRLFALMAGEIAAIENQPPVASVPTNPTSRREELKAIESELAAINALENYNNIIQIVENSYRTNARFFIVQYNYDLHEVNIIPQYFSKDFAEHYRTAEGNQNVDSVLVEADRIDDLRAAFPNYFLDVSLFTQLLKARILGEDMPTLARRYIRHPSSGYRDLGEVMTGWLQWRK